MLFYYDTRYWAMLLPVLLITIYAQCRVSANFNRYSKVTNLRRLTGAQAAEAVLHRHGVYDVRIERVRGNLTDHYDPRTNVIRLSDPVCYVDSVAAVGVAAHEAGHAAQYAAHYAPIRWRAALVPVTQIGSNLSMPVLLIGYFFQYRALILAGIILYSFSVLFSLVTLPVELNASARAVAALRDSGALYGEELEGAQRVLRAAAMTYLAATFTALWSLLRLLLIFGNRRQR